MMLANIEHKLEENLAAIERMPQEEVEKAEKEREKDRRARVRAASPRDKASNEEETPTLSTTWPNNSTFESSTARDTAQRKAGSPSTSNAVPLVCAWAGTDAARRPATATAERPSLSLILLLLVDSEPKGDLNLDGKTG